MMRMINYPFSLEYDGFSGYLKLCNGSKTPPKSVQMVILYVLRNVPGGTQATMPTYQYTDINGNEAMIRQWYDGTGQEDANFRAAPNAVDVVWQPYGTIRVQKVKEILDEKIERHFLSPDRVIRTVRYGWQLQWSQAFAQRIDTAAKQFAARVNARLHEKLQTEVRESTTRITVTEKYIGYNSGGSYTRYISFEKEGLVDFSSGVEVLGCAYAVRGHYDNPGEWKISTYFNSSTLQCTCTMRRDPKPVRRQW